MGRNPCCSKVGLNRGAWTTAEDKILIDFIKLHGEGRWRTLPKRAGLNRCGKSCRLRWLNYLRPDIKRGNITWDEEELIVRLHKLLGNKWSLIAGRLPGRTDNEIKNYWNTNLRKRVDENDPNKTRKSTKNESTSTVVVVRTKATRCSKRFTGPDGNIKKTDNNKNSSNSNNNNEDSSFVVNDLRDARPAGFHNKVQQNSSSFMRQDDHNHACVLDDDLLNISDVLNSVEPWGDQELLDGDKKGKGPFCDEMQLQDWFDAQDFTQIPDFGGDWLANIPIL